MTQIIDKKEIINSLTLDIHHNIRHSCEHFDRIKMKLELTRRNTSLSPTYWNIIDRDINRIVLIKQQLRDLEIMSEFYHSVNPLNLK
jgi:hypothetical protein